MQTSVGQQALMSARIPRVPFLVLPLHFRGSLGQDTTPPWSIGKYVRSTNFIERSFVNPGVPIVHDADRWFAGRGRSGPEHPELAL